MRIPTILMIAGLGAAMAAAQTPTTQASASAASKATATANSNGSALAVGTRMDAELKSKLDTKNAKVGDSVTAVTTSAVKEHGTTVLPKGTTLHGHVTEVTKAESSKSPSRIGVLFDQATTKQGQVIPLRAGIVSVVTATAAGAADAGTGMDDMPMPQAMPAGGGMSGGGVADGVAGGVGRTVDSAGAVVGGTADGMGRATLGDQPVPAAVTQNSGELAAMARASNGVPISISTPDASVAGSTSQQSAVGSVLSSPRGDLEISSGTRVALQVMRR